jgi:hypothetical protein
MENHPRKRDMFRIINTGVFQICSNRVQVLQKITDFTKILTESKADDVVHNYCLNLMAQKFLVSETDRFLCYNTTMLKFAVKYRSIISILVYFSNRVFYVTIEKTTITLNEAS